MSIYICITLTNGFTKPGTGGEPLKLYCSSTSLTNLTNSLQSFLCSADPLYKQTGTVVLAAVCGNLLYSTQNNTPLRAVPLFDQRLRDATAVGRITHGPDVVTIAGRIELETMTVEEGMLFLLRRIKSTWTSTALESSPESVWSLARAIVEAMDGLPLALDQARAYIEETRSSPHDYLKLYRARRQRLLRMRGQDAAGHPEPVATTWSLSLEKIKQANPAAAELLRLLALLHPDSIPESMIVAAEVELGPILQPVVREEFDFNEAIGELHKYSLIQNALALHEHLLGPDNPELAQTLSGLASLYYEQGKYAQAEPLYQHLDRSRTIIRLLLKALLRIGLPGHRLVKQVWSKGHIFIGAVEDWSS